MGSQESACGNSGVDTRQDPPDSHELDDVEVELLLPSPPDIASNTSKPVVLADVQEKAILAAAEELVAAGHKALAIPCDVSDDVQVEAMVTRTVASSAGLTQLSTTQVSWFGSRRPPTAPLLTGTASSGLICALFGPA